MQYQTLFATFQSGGTPARDSHFFVAFAFQVAADSEIGVKLLDKSWIKAVQVSFGPIMLLKFHFSEGPVSIFLHPEA